MKSLRAYKAADAMLAQLFKSTLGAGVRVDVLTWDTEDVRHCVEDRDDVANLGRMYYHVFRDVLRNRWPDSSTWLLRPDRNSALDWDTMRDCLDWNALEPGQRSADLFTPDNLGDFLRQRFRIERIDQAESKDEPLVQMADLLAGMGVYSRNRHDRVLSWRQNKAGQTDVFQHAVSWTGTVIDDFRCKLIHAFNDRCKAKRMGVSLATDCGLHTFEPDRPLNFWWYVPQHPRDRAPSKTERIPSANPQKTGKSGTQAIS